MSPLETNPLTPGGAVTKTFWEQMAETRWGQYLTQIERDALDLAIGMAVHGVALEVGCEGGRWSTYLHTRGFANICVDVDRKALALCQSRLPEANCILTTPEAQRFPEAPDHSVDLLLVYETDPVTSAPWFPAEAFRVLKLSGILVCTLMNPTSMRGLAHKLRRDTSYYRGPPYRVVRRQLLDNGFALAYERGFAWGPFSRDSNASLVPFWAALEERLGLRALSGVSPWVVLVAQKSK